MSPGRRIGCFEDRRRQARPNGWCIWAGPAQCTTCPTGHIGSVVPRFDQGDERLPGYLKMWCDDLRDLACRLSDPAARVLTIAAAIPRTSDGAMLNGHETIDLTGSRLARALPGLNERTARRAVAELIALRLVMIIQPHAGQRGAQYQPTGALVTRIQRRRHIRRPRASGTQFQHGIVHGGNHLSDKPSSRPRKAATVRAPEYIPAALSDKRDPIGTPLPDKSDPGI